MKLKTIMCALLILSIVSPASAALQDPKKTIESGTCVVISYCSENPSGAVSSLGSDLYTGLTQNKWYQRLWQEDTTDLGESSQLFQADATGAVRVSADVAKLIKSNSTKDIICQTTGSNPVPLTGNSNPKKIIIELWEPGCGETLPLCNDAQVSQYGIYKLPDNSGKPQAVFISNGKSFFKGAGFYTHCADYDNGSSEAILVAGNSHEALEAASVSLLAELKKLSGAKTKAELKYYLDDKWATSAVVGFTEDLDGINEFIESNNLKDSTHNPIVVIGGDSKGGLADTFLNLGRNYNERPPYLGWLPGSDWLNPDTKGYLAVAVSASKAFSLLKANTTDSLAYQLFAKLNTNQDNKERILNATLYGCQEAYVQENGQTRLDPAKQVLKTTDTYLLDASAAYSPAANRGDMYVVKVENGKYYAGEYGLACTFDPAYSGKSGNCQASVLGGFEYSKKADGEDFCKDDSKGALSGNIGEYGVHWDGYKTDGGKVEFISGLNPCTTRGMLNTANYLLGGREYFTNKPGIDKTSFVPKCSSIGASSASGYKCPFKGTGTQDNVEDAKIGWSEVSWCACVVVNEGMDWKMISGGVASGVVAPPAIVPPPTTGPKTCAESGGSWIGKNDFCFSGLGAVQSPTDAASNSDKICCYAGALDCNKKGSAALAETQYCPDGVITVAGALPPGRTCCNSDLSWAVEKCVAAGGEAKAIASCADADKMTSLSSVTSETLKVGLTDRGIVCCKKSAAGGTVQIPPRPAIAGQTATPNQAAADNAARTEEKKVDAGLSSETKTEEQKTAADATDNAKAAVKAVDDAKQKVVEATDNAKAAVGTPQEPEKKADVIAAVQKLDDEIEYAKDAVDDVEDAADEVPGTPEAVQATAAAADATTTVANAGQARTNAVNTAAPLQGPAIPAEPEPSNTPTDGSLIEREYGSVDPDGKYIKSLSGAVTNMVGKPIGGAKISSSAGTIITADGGTFSMGVRGSFAGFKRLDIGMVKVSKEGYAPSYLKFSTFMSLLEHPKTTALLSAVLPGGIDIEESRKTYGSTTVSEYDIYVRVKLDWAIPFVKYNNG